MTEIYVSVDIEADGPTPGDYSMLSFGAVAFHPKLGNEIGHFEANLEVLPKAMTHPDTMDWWATQGDAYAKTRKNLVRPMAAMELFSDWLRDLGGPPVFVGYPCTFDQMFVHWYMIHFTGEDPFGFSGLDIKTYAMALLDTPYKKTVKKKMPKEWFEGLDKHTHVAIEDAREQGQLFMKMLEYRSGMRIEHVVPKSQRS